MKDTEEKLLHRIDNRLARVEERLKDLPSIKAKLDSLSVRSAGTAATVALIVTLALVFLTRVAA